MKKPTTLILLFLTLSIQAQYTCETAQSASAGSNTLPATDSSEYWYSYTMAGDNMLIIETDLGGGYFSVNSGCSGYIYLEGGWSPVVTEDLSAGQEVYIKFETFSGGDFNWTLTEHPVQKGDICAIPDTAQKGTNTLRSTPLEYYWYRYIMPRDGKLVVSSTANEYVSIYNDYCTNWPESLAGGSRRAVTSQFVAGEELFIRWETQGGGDFEWNISIEEIADGDKPSGAIPALEGTNTVPATTSSYYWYAIQVPAEGAQLNITVPTYSSITLYQDFWNPYYYYSQAYGTEVTFNTLTPGETYYLKLPLGNGGDFDWTLSWSALETGEACWSAATAQLGRNSVPATDKNYYYYSYVMPQNGKLMVSNDDNKYVHLHVGSCLLSGNQSYGSGSVTLPELLLGDTVIITWETYSGGDFDWELSVGAMEAGEACSVAANATEGVNHVPETNASYYWATATIPEGSKAIITSTDGNYFHTHLGTCDNYYSVDASSGTTVVANYPEPNLLLEWEADGGDFDWNLQFAALESGDVCSLAVAAQSGTNTLATSNHQEYWYTYTMPSAGNLVITSDANNYVRMQKGTCELATSYVNGKNRVEATNLSPGDEVYIVWSLYGQNVNFEWDLAIEAQQSGDNCSLAVGATEGTNTLPVTDNYQYWYTFTMPETAKLVIDSETEKYVSVYTGSCDVLNFKGNNRSSLEITNLESGDLVSIAWKTEGSGDFDWTLSIEALEAGDNCELAKTAEVGVNLMRGIALSNHWYTFTMPYEAQLQCNAYESIFLFGMTGSCDSLSYNTYGYSSMQTESYTAGENVLIQVQQMYPGTVAWYLNVQRTQSISFPAIPRQDIDADSLVLNASASSGLPVSYRIIDGPVTLNSNMVHFNGIGNVTIEAYQNGNDTLAAATPVRQSFQIANINSLEQELLPELTLYPNPVSESFYLNTGSIHAEQLALYTPDGRLVQRLNPAENHFDVSGLKPGMYVLQVQVNQSRFSYRLLKQ